MAEINNIEDIKENFEKITNLINSMRAQGVLSFSGVDKVLGAINTKIDNINIEEDTDLIKMLIGEVKTNLEERHGFIVSKFSEVESAINTLVKNDEDSLKSSEVRKIFDVIATNLGVFSKEVVAQKDALTEITLRLESLRADDTDKKEIINTISNVKFDITRINNGFESIILNINNNFRELSESFEKLAASNMADRYGNTIEDIQGISNTILSAIQMIDKKNSDFNDNLNQLVTIGDFKQAQEVLLNLSAKNDELKSSLDYIADRESVNNLSNVINSSLSAINDLKQVVVNNTEEKNSQLLAQLNYLEDVVRQSSSDFDFSKFKTELLDIVSRIGDETNGVYKDILESNTELKRLLSSVNLEDFNNRFENIQTHISQNESNIQRTIETLSDRINSDRQNAINTILNNFNAQLDELNQRFDLFKNEINSSEQENTNSIISNISHFADLAQDINSKIETGNTKNIEEFNQAINSVKQDLERFSSSINENSRASVDELVEKLNGLFSTTSDLKTELMVIAENNVNKVTSGITGLSEVVSTLSKHISDIKLDSPAQINKKLKELDKDLKDLLSGLVTLNNTNSDTIISNISQIYTQLNSLSDDLKSVYNSNSEGIKSIVEELYNKINDLNTELPNILFHTTSNLSDNIASMQEKVDGTNTYLEQISNLITNEDFQKAAIDRIDAINADIRFVLDNLTTAVSDNSNSISEKIAEITNDIRNLSDSMLESIGHNNVDMTTRLNSLTETLLSVRDEVVKGRQPDENLEIIKQTLDTISGEIKNVSSEVAGNISENSGVWLEKLDTITNNAFDIKNAILSGLHGVNLDLTDKLGNFAGDIKNTVGEISGQVENNTNILTERLDGVSNDIKNTVGEISGQVEDKTNIITERLGEVSKDVKNVTDKLANYFINNDSDIATKVSEIGSSVNIANSTTSERMSQLENSTLNISDKLDEMNELLVQKTDITNANVSSRADMLSEKLDTVSSEITNVTGEIVNHFLTNNDRAGINAENINKNIDFTRGEVLERLQSSSDAINTNVEEVKSELNSIQNKLEDSQKVSENTALLAQKLDNITSDIKGVTNELINQISLDDEEKNTKFHMLHNSIDFAKQNLIEYISNNDVKIASVADSLNAIKSEIIEADNSNHNNMKSSLNETIQATETNIGQKLESLAEKVHNAKEELTLQLQNNNLAEAMETVKSDLRAFNENLRVTTEELSSKIQDNSNLETIENIKTELRAFNEKFSSATDEMNAYRDIKVQDIHSNINSSRDAIVDKLSSLANSNYSNITEQFAQYKDAIEDAIRNSFNSNSTEVVNTVNRIVEMIDSQNDKHSEQTQEVLDNVKQSLSMFQSTIESANDTITNASKHELTQLLASLNTMVDEFKNLETELKDSAAVNKLELIDNINNLSSTVSRMSDDIQIFVDDKLNDIVNKILLITGKIDYAEQSVLQKIDDSKFSADEKFLNISDRISDIKETLSEKTDGVHGNINAKFDELLNKLNEIAYNGVSISGENYNNICSKLNEIKDIYETSSQNQDFQKSEVFDKIFGYIDNIKNIVEDSDLRISESINSLQDLKNESLSIFNESKQIINNQLENIKGEANGQYNHILTNIESLKLSLKNKDEMDDKFNDIEAALINLTRELRDLGGNGVSNDNINSLKAEIFGLQEVLKDYIANNSAGKCDLILSELSKAIDSLSETLQDFIAAKMSQEEGQLKSSIETTLDSKMGGVSNYLNGIENSIDEIKLMIEADNTNSNINSLESNIKSNMTDVINHTDNLSQNIDNKFSLIDNYFTGITNSIDEIRAIVASNTDNNEQLQTIDSEIKDKLSAIEHSLNTSVQEKTDILSGLINNLENSIQELDNNIDEDTTRQLNIIQDELSSVSSALFTNTDKLNLASKAHFDEVLEKFANTQEIITALKEEFEGLFSTNNDEIKAGLNNLNTLFDKSAEIKSQIIALDNIIRDHVEGLVEQIKANSSQDLVDACINKLEAVENKIDKLDFSSINSENADKIIMSNIETIEQKIDSMSENLDTLTRNTLSNEVENLKNAIFEQKERIKELVKATDLDKLPNLENINQLIETNLIDLLEKFNKKFDETSVETLLNEEIGKLKSDLLSQTVKILDQISFEVEQAEILDSIQENTNNVKSEISDFKADILAKITTNKAEILCTLADKNDIDSISQKLEDLSDHYEMERGFDAVQSRFDQLIDNNFEPSFDTLYAKLDSLANDSLEKGLDSLSSNMDSHFNSISNQIDDVVDNSIEKGFEEVKSQLETVANSDDLQKEFSEVKKHLLSIQSGDSNFDYAYSLQDVESDIAKLRIAMKELRDIIPDEELYDINKKVNGISLVVDSIRNQISQAEINEIGEQVERMKDDVVSISTRTNKLLLTSENSANLLKDNVDAFRLVIDDIDERTRAMAESYDLSDVHTSISSIQKSIVENENHNEVVNKSLVAIAEWVDCAGATLASISDKVEKIDDIEDVKSLIKNLDLPAQFDYSVFDKIEERFTSQQNKIDVLEEKLNKLTELVEANDNTQITKKITSVDKQLSKLNKSIERLTSYVDEE